MSKPQFNIQKVSNHGASHPVVARLVMQTDDLLGFLDKKKKAEAMRIYIDLHKRLLQCHDIAERIFKEKERALAYYIAALPSGSTTIPHVINLDMEAESFLLVAKQYIRDLVKAINLLLKATLKIDSAVFWDHTGAESSVVKWAKRTYGNQHPTTQMFSEEDKWISELVKKRNAVEHPGGFSGTLVVENYKHTSQGIVPPSWRRDGSANAPSDIFRDLRTYLENMLTLGEDIVAKALEHSDVPKIFKIAEIPVERRSKVAPRRLMVVLSEDAIAAAKRSD
ncbi:hypothetical protein GHK50_29805 [Sinorhizobium medicae]|uniref:Uncharacterized protein n=1 Tax=Sinorhizobium medicae TaxID=110321 RepID=A0A6G1WDU2_9HYPH|nr:hypothetical protein [Sinorhizobium medicae]MQW67872.1 hypothetical protein [Sinorhizobium medicae]MQX87073.1 hypothetical protein [Sinorhizobium medicae]